jgi:uncharacterized protein YndB with AHSA1/START domain
MNSRVQQPEATWSVHQWTSAPLQLKRSVALQARPGVVFATLTDPEQMCDLFSWMHAVGVDNHDASEPNGVGAKRRCHFGNGMVLEEVIVGWEPPTRYAYLGVDETHPFGMTGHLGTIECQPDGTGTRLVWSHYFEHANPEAMLEQLSASIEMAINSLVERFQESSVSLSESKRFGADRLR